MKILDYKLLSIEEAEKDIDIEFSNEYKSSEVKQFVMS